jgi:hypothetical protein
MYAPRLGPRRSPHRRGSCAFQGAVAAAFASSATARFPCASASPMMPLPTTAASSSIVPRNSDPNFTPLRDRSTRRLIHRRASVVFISLVFWNYRMVSSRGRASGRHAAQAIGGTGIIRPLVRPISSRRSCRRRVERAQGEAHEELDTVFQLAECLAKGERLLHFAPLLRLPSIRSVKWTRLNHPGIPGDSKS